MSDLWYGIQNSLDVTSSVKLLSQYAKLRKHIRECIFLNGVIFMGTVLLFDLIHFIIPAGLSPYLTVIQNVFWFIPIYVLSLIINCFNYQDISNVVKNSKHHRKNNILAHELYRTIMFISIEVILGILPVWRLACLVYLSWIYSFYAHDYQWTNHGYSLKYRLYLVEYNWLYHLGFGLPLSLAIYFFPGYYGYSVYSILFPFMIINAANKSHQKPTKELYPIQIFFIPQKITNFIVKSFFDRRSDPSRISPDTDQE
jgi:etoposide-induced 2.4 mRNA